MKTTITSIIIAVIFIGGALMLTASGRDLEITNVNNVRIINGKQIIEIRAKGGYQPRKSLAQAGIPTVLRFDTNGTFDCSSVVRIPSLGISKVLPLSGSTDIDIGNPKLTLLQGTCGMGMYPFEIDFQT